MLQFKEQRDNRLFVYRSPLFIGVTIRPLRYRVVALHNKNPEYKDLSASDKENDTLADLCGANFA